MRSQRWLHIIPVSFIMYTIAFIDRTNVSLALPSMSRALHMNPTQAGGTAGVFFWGYVLLQIPGGHLAQHWSAKRFVSVLLVMWGLCSVGCGLVQTWQQFWVMRLLLGVAEGGVWPAVLVLLSHWFPRGERARANAYWMLCLPIAVILSSPLSGWILGRWNWRVLLIAEGALPFFWLVIWWIFIDDYPKEARWISTEERDYLEATLLEESRELDSVKPDPSAKADPFWRALLKFWRALLNPTVLVMVGIYLMQNIGNYGYLFWLPSALENARKMSNLRVGVLSGIPYIVTAIGMVLVSRHSDKRRERRGHVAFGLAWGGACMMACILLTGHAPTLGFVAISLVGAGTYGMLGPFWAIPTETLPRSVSGPAMGLVNALGNLGGYFGPLAVGFVYHHTGDFRYAFALLSLAFLTGASATLFLPSRAAARE
ncbi:MAG: MFS transporter [Terriglobia bacterium]|jgi:MFS family permease